MALPAYTSPRLADKAALDFGDPGESGRRQRTLFDRAGGVFEVLHRRIADEYCRDRRLRDDIADRGFDQAIGMALADERCEAASALDIVMVIGARADRRR